MYLFLFFLYFFYIPSAPAFDVSGIISIYYIKALRWGVLHLKARSKRTSLSLSSPPLCEMKGGVFSKLTAVTGIGCGRLTISHKEIRDSQCSLVCMYMSHCVYDICVHS